MSVVTIKPFKVINPKGETLEPYNKNCVVESDKITILPNAGETETVLVANGYQFYLLADITEIASKLGSKDMSSYT